MKKAQMEIVGLLLIVIIVVVVFFFMISINIDSASEEQDIVFEFTDTHITTNFPPILLESSSNCTDTNDNYIPIKELIDLCANNPSFECHNEGVCVFLNETIENAINSTLNDMWNYRYHVTITNGTGRDTKFEDVDLITNISKNCIPMTNSITNTQVIPLSRGLRSQFQLRICI